MTSIQNPLSPQNHSASVLQVCNALADDDCDPQHGQNVQYLCDVFIKACISALQSDTYGPWIYLIEIINAIKPFASTLLKSKKVLHYLYRVFQHCDVDPEINKLNLLPLLDDAFPHVDFSKSFSTTISSINSQNSNIANNTKKVTLKSEGVSVNKDVYFPGDFETLFSIGANELNGRIYEPAALKVTDLQRFLPDVVSDVSRLECTWHNSLGLTFMSLNTELPQFIYKENQVEPVKNENKPILSEKKEKKSRSSLKPVPITGREVVESLVRSTRRTQIKVWYLNFVQSTYYNPYNLMVTEKAAVKKEHVVISVFGVLYVRLNGMSELLSLGQWYCEAVCFDTIRHIRFFRMHREIKTFFKWKSVIKRVHFEKKQKRLDVLLLHKIPAIPNCILRLRELLEQIQVVDFFPNFQNTHIHMEALESVMKSYLIEQKRYLKKFLLFCWEVIASCYEECVNYHEYCKEQVEKDNTNSKESMAVMKKKYKIQVNNERTAFENLKDFDKFLKLINLMIFSELVTIFNKKLQQFISKQIMQNSVGSFQVTVFTSPEEIITLVPSTNTIFENLHTIFQSVLEQLQFHVTIIIKTIIKSNVSETNNLLDHFDSYWEVDATSLETLQEVLSEESKTFSKSGCTKRFIDATLFTQLKDSISTQISLENAMEKLKYELDMVASKEAENYFGALYWLEVIANSVHKFNLHDLEDWTKQSAAEIEKNIVTMKCHQTHMEDMQIHYITSNNLLYIDSSEIKQMLLPQIKVMLKLQVENVLNQNLDEANKYIEELTKALKILSITSLEVEEFSNYYVYMNSMKEKVALYQENIEHLRAVFDVVRLSYSSLTQDQEQIDEELRVAWEKFQHTLQTGQEFISAHAPALTTTLNEEIKKMTYSALEIAKTSTTGKFLDKEQNTREILTDLTKNFDTFCQLARKVRIYAECRKLITCEETNFNSLNEAQQTITTRYEIWKYLEHTMHTINHWRLSPFTKFRANMTKVVEKVTEWRQACDSLKVHVLESDGVLLKWVQLLDGFQENLTILHKLVHPSLKEKHWVEIFIVLGANYEPSYPYTVADIFDMPIRKNYDRINVIWLSAISQASLELKKKDNSLVGYTLAGLDDLSFQVEDSLVTLQSMLVSPHVADVKSDASFWSHQLQELKEYIDLFLVVQQQWQYLLKIFRSKTMQENHAAEYQIFTQINATFRDIMTSLMNDPRVLNILAKTKLDTNWRELQGTKLKSILNDTLQKQSVVIKQLEDYLSKIRGSFPRLYFLSNNEMLQLLAVTRNPPSLKPFIRRCFPGVHNVQFEMPPTSSTKVFTQLDISLNAHLLEAVSITGHFNEELLFTDRLQFDLSLQKSLKKFDYTLKKSVWFTMSKCIKEFTELYQNLKVCMDIQLIKQHSLHRKYTFQALLLTHDWMWNQQYKKALNKTLEIEQVIKLFNVIIEQLTDFIRRPQQWGFSSLADRRFLILTQSFLLQALYYRDKLNNLMKNKDSTNQSFALFTNIEVEIVKKSCQFELKQHDFNIEVQCCGATLCYGYEYLSPKRTLLITPLTERCFYTIFLAIKDFQVGCVTGKETPGKSETVYFAAQKLGRLLTNVNCTNDVSLVCFQQILHGGLSAGSLVCLKNIHLLPINYLSVIGQNLFEIRTALNLLSVQKKDVFDNERCYSVAEVNNIPNPAKKDNTVKNEEPFIKPSLGVILMNNRLVEVNSLYGCVAVFKGNFNCWKEVPDNFREALRPISFHYPFTVKIYEAWLLIGGFVKFQSIAKKVNVFVNECEKELKITVLSMKKVTNLILQSAKTFHSDKVADHNLEESYLVQTFLQSLRPSLKHDSFVSLVQKIALIFPSCQDQLQNIIPQDALLIESVKEQLHADNLVLKQDFMNKILELHRILSTNRSVILLGNTCTGKTTCYTTLCRALCQFYSPWSHRKDLSNRNKDGNFARTNLNIIFPNMLKNGQLFGEIDNVKGSWIDGLLTKLLDKSCNQIHTKSTIQQWIVLDGSIHDSWIVPFETLLNYSKQYTLASTKSVQIPDDAKLLFETDSLECVSPSLVSSSAIIYFTEDHAVDWKMVFISWKNVAYSKFTLEQYEFNVIEEVLNYVLNQIVSFINTECEDIFTADVYQPQNIPRCAGIVACGYVLQMLSALLNVWRSRKDRTKEHVVLSKCEREKFICHVVAWSVANAFAAFVHERSLSKLDTFIRQTFSTCPVVPVLFPTNMLDCYFDGKIGELITWNQMKYETGLSVPSNYVTTKDFQKLHHVSHLLLASEKNIMYVGPPASGKSTFVKHFLSNSYTITKLQTSKALTVEDFQNKLSSKSKSLMEEKAHYKMKTTGRSKQGHLIFFIDDIHEACSSKMNGEKANLECLRQVTSEGGMYNITEKYYQYLPHTNFILSYTPSGSNKLGADYNQPLNARFYRHFNLLRFNTLNNDNMQAIFTVLCTKWLNSFDWFPCKDLFVQMISSTTLSFQNYLEQQLSVKYLHCTYSFHDVARVIKSLFFFTLDSQHHITTAFHEYFYGKPQIFVQTSIAEFLDDQDTFEKSKEIVMSTLLTFVQLYFHELKNIYSHRVLESNSDVVITKTNAVQKFQCLVDENLLCRQDTKNDLTISFLTILKNVVNQESAEDISFTRLLMENGLLSTYKKVKKMDFKNLLENMNEDQLFIHDGMIDHCAAVVRILNFPGGHALLISKDGHGRKKVVNLAAKLMAYNFFEIPSMMCSTQHKVLIKDACNTAGLGGKPTILLVCDDVTTDILDLLSALINDGHCPGLYTSAELNLLSTQLLPGSHRNRNLENIFAIEDRFYQRIKKNLHVIFCVKFNRLNDVINRYPMVLNKMALVDVYEEWTESVLVTVAKQQLIESRFQQESFQLLDDVTSLTSKIHLSTKDFMKNNEDYRNMNSPLKYLEFVDLFQSICRLVSFEKTNELKHLEKAVAKITQAENEKARILSELERNLPLIKQAKAHLTAAEKGMINTQNDYNKIKEQCSDQTEKIRQLEEPVKSLTERTQTDFDQLSPLYEAAVNALQLVDAHAVEELRSYRLPPHGVIEISQMLCIMFGVNPTWEDAKLLLMRDKFFEELQFYDKDNLSNRIFSALSKFIQTPIAELRFVQTQSKAAYQLAVWMHAIHSYCKILRKLQPKKDELAQAKRDVVLAEKELGDLKIQCGQAKDDLECKIQEFKEKGQQLKELEAKQRFLLNSKDHATLLLQSMEVFSTKWYERISIIQSLLATIITMSVLAAASVVYSGILTTKKQEELFQQWISLFPEHEPSLNTDKVLLDMLSLLDEEVEWQNSNNNMIGQSLLNNVLRVRCLNVLGSKCWPLFIDPDDKSELLVRMIEDGHKDPVSKLKQHATWISKACQIKQQKYEKRSNKSQTRKLTQATEHPETTPIELILAYADDPMLDEVIKSAMQHDQPLFIKNIERLPNDNILLKAIMNRSKLHLNNDKFELHVENNVLELSCYFRLYLSASVSMTYLTKEKYSLPVHQTIPINMELEMTSLCQYLHHIIVLKEKPGTDLQVQRLKVDLQYLKEEQNTVHSTILTSVADIPIKLVERKNVRDYMAFHQEKLLLITEKYMASQSYLKDQMKELDAYSPLSDFLSRVFFLIQHICSIHPLYTFSLQAFCRILTETFEESRTTKSVAADVSSRLEEIKKIFTRRIFLRLSKALFNEHVLLFPLCLVLEKAQNTWDICDEEWDLFISSFKGTIKDQNGRDENNNCVNQGIESELSRPSWINTLSWSRFSTLSKVVPSFKGLLTSLIEKSDLWVEYFKLSPMLLNPYCYSENLHKYHLALLWLAYDDSLFPSICKNMILCHLGPQFVQIPPFKFADACNLSNTSTISMIVLPDDQQCIVEDPIEAISKLSKSKKITRMVVVSLGTTDEMEHATNALDQASKSGFWLILNNCDMVKTWSKDFLKKLMYVLDTLRSEILFEESLLDKSELRKLKRKISPKFRLFMIMRSVTTCFLHDYILRKSNTIIWQYGKNSEIHIKENIHKSIKEFNLETQLEEMTTQIYVDEVLKNRHSSYADSVKLSSLDKYFIANLSTAMNKFHTGLNNQVNEIAILPGLSSQFDQSMLHKNLDKINILEANNEGCSLQSSNLTRLYCLTNQPPVTVHSHKVQQIYNCFHKLVSTLNIRKPIMLTQQYIIGYLRREIRHLGQCILSCCSEVVVLSHAMEGRAPFTSRLLCLLKGISRDCVPDIWRSDVRKEMTLTEFLKDLQHKLSYLNSLLFSSDNVVKLNLSYFHDPISLITAIKYQYSSDMEVGIMDKHWIGQVLPSDFIPNNIYLTDGILFEHLILHNAHVNGTKILYLNGHSSSGLMILFKPMQQNIEKDRTVPVYGNNFKDIVFEIDSMNSCDSNHEMFFTIQVD